MAQRKYAITGGWRRAIASPQLRESGGSPVDLPQPPIIQLLGEFDHPDFCDAISLLRNDSHLIAHLEERPELILVAQSRPDLICIDELNQLRRIAPLAGIVALAGSWCEGETRTGRPWPGAQRIYWYEFPVWWRRQLQLRAANRCPDWARSAVSLPRQSVPGHPRSRSGLIVLRSPHRDNADALADALNQAGHSTAWQRYSRATAHTRGALAGVWDGGQLNDAEITDLAAFCVHMSRDDAPVVALLDFPRRDRVDEAYRVGAVAVLGKPYLNSDLLATLEFVAASPRRALAA